MVVLECLLTCMLHPTTTQWQPGHTSLHAYIVPGPPLGGCSVVAQAYLFVPMLCVSQCHLCQVLASPQCDVGHPAHQLLI